MDWESSEVIRFDFEQLLQIQTRIAKLKSAYSTLFIIGLSVLRCQTNHGQGIF